MAVIVLAGASGGIGTTLHQRLVDDGHEVRQLVRSEPGTEHQSQWDPDAAELPEEVLDGADAVINLGGVGVGDKRWTPQYRQLITSSRVRGTGLLARALADRAADGTTIRFIQASAVGYYGDAGEQELTESAPQGEGFLAHVCQAWEHAAQPAVDAGVSVAFLRTGIVLDPDSGALARMLPLLKFGVAGPLGSGKQWWPWITLSDHVRAVTHLLTSELTGPINLSAPHPARNAELTKALAAELNRPAIVPAPKFGLRIVLGEFASELTASQRAVPAALLADGFSFDYPTIDAAASHLLG